MKHKISIIILFFLPVFCLAQETWKPLFSIKGKFKFIRVDELNNLFAATPENTFYKFDKNGSELFSINLKLPGDLQDMDVSNPFEILLNYPASNLVILTDNTFNKIGEMDLMDLGYSQAWIICNSWLEGFWIFDNADMKLKRINEEGKVLSQSENLFNLYKRGVEPVFMREYDGWVYVTDPRLGILVFDVYGSFLRTLPYEFVESFSLSKDIIFFYAQKKLNIINRKTFEKNGLTLPAEFEGRVKDVRARGNRLYILTSDGVNVLQN